MIALVRVDARLIHGQVVEAWLPMLGVRRILVADDEAAASPITRAAIAIAVPPDVQVEVAPLSTADFARAQACPERVLVLLRDIVAVAMAMTRGLRVSTLNVGNVHFGSGRTQVTPSVFLSASDLSELHELSSRGVAVELRAVPGEQPLVLAELEARLTARRSGLPPTPAAGPAMA